MNESKAVLPSSQTKNRNISVIRKPGLWDEFLLSGQSVCVCVQLSIWTATAYFVVLWSGLQQDKAQVYRISDGN